MAAIVPGEDELMWYMQDCFTGLDQSPRGLIKHKDAMLPVWEIHCGDKILWPFYLHNGISDTGKMAYLYWIKARIASLLMK